jgi:hypothetical protein
MDYCESCYICKMELHIQVRRPLNINYEMLLKIIEI